MNMDDLDAMYAAEDAALASSCLAKDFSDLEVAPSAETETVAEKVELQVPAAKSGADLAKWVPVVHQKVIVLPKILLHPNIPANPSKLLT
jgi:hypothetical protein